MWVTGISAWTRSFNSRTVEYQLRIIRCSRIDGDWPETRNGIELPRRGSSIIHESFRDLRSACQDANHDQYRKDSNERDERLVSCESVHEYLLDFRQWHSAASRRKPVPKLTRSRGASRFVIYREKFTQIYVG